MTLNFNFESIQSTDFGVGRDDDAGETFSLIPIDGNVQDALDEMGCRHLERYAREG